MANDLLESHKSKLMQLAFGLGFMVLVLVAIKMLMAGNYSKIGAVVALLAGVGIVLALDRYYWVLCPFFFTFSVDYPGPFDGAELGMMSIVAVHFIRSVLHKEKPLVVDSRILVALPMFLWIVVIWGMNPAGLGVLGSRTMGLRFYIKLALAFLTLLSLSTIRLTESDCKVLFRTLFYSAIAASIIAVFSTNNTTGDAFVVGTGIDADLYADYRFVNFVYPFGLLFSRWTLLSILLSPWKLVFAGICAVFVIVSGKRLSFGFLMLIPFARALLSRRNVLATGVAAAVGFCMLVFAVVGDGTIYHLPKSATRTLAVVFPKYRTTRTEGFRDTFRVFMREQARMVIRENPWFGRKGFAFEAQEASWLGSRAQAHFMEGHAFVGNWHTTWHGMAADFGIPGAVLWALFYLYLLCFVFRNNGKMPLDSYRQTCCLWYSLLLLNNIVFSYFYGHSAWTPQNVWVEYGMLLAIVDCKPQNGCAS